MNIRFPLESRITLPLRKTQIFDARDLAFGNGCLCVISGAFNGSFAMYCDEDGELRRLGELTGLGSTVRQLRVSGMVAVVSARSFGAYFIDISAPSRPEILFHYDTVEFATGVAVDGNMVYIACRQMGVEAIDISDPRHPKHVSTLRAGEVQSVRVQDGILYAGAWNQRQIQIYDVSDPGNPQKLSEVPLSGKGDGMFIRDGICYAALGQHTGDIKRPTADDPGYGYGNGLAIIDVSDPANPKMLSESMLPYAYYYCNYDMWSTIVCGHYCVMAHTFNGVLIYDVADPRHPLLVSHVPIPAALPADQMMDLSPSTMQHYPPRIPFDTDSCSFAPVTGVASADGKLFIAVGREYLRILESRELFCENRIVGHRTETYSNYNQLCPGEQVDGAELFEVQGQVHELAAFQNRLYAACGNGGIRIFDPVTMALQHTVETREPVRSVRVAAGKVYAACTTEGVNIYEPTGDSLHLIGHYCVPGETCAQVVPAKNGRFVMCHINGNTLVILDVSEPSSPQEVLRDRQRPSLIYHRQMSTDGAGDRYYCVYWANKRTVHWYDLSGEKPLLMPWTQYGLNFRNGITGLPDGRVLMPARERGYILAPVDAGSDLMTSPAISVGTGLIGKPAVFDDALAVTDTMTGQVKLVNIGDVEQPKLTREFSFSGHPDLGCRVGNTLFIPLHYQGIARISL